MKKTVFALTLAFTSSSQAVLAQTRIAAVAQPMVASAQPVQQLQVPAPEALIIMIRSSLVALSQANTTNNYTVLNALGSPSFRAANSPDRLAQTFSAFRANNIDLAPVTLIQPQLSEPARIEDGRLRMKGFFPSQPLRVVYDLSFEPVGGRWQLFALGVNLDQTSAQPNNGQQAPSPKAIPKPKK